jgi:hypothetical protein
MTALCIVAGSLIVYFAILSPTAALLLGRVIKLADSKTPAVGTGAGKASPDRGARHLTVVR